MVDFSKIAPDLLRSIHVAINSDNNSKEDVNRVNSQKEYNKLSALLSGCEADSEARLYINALMGMFTGEVHDAPGPMDMFAAIPGAGENEQMPIAGAALASDGSTADEQPPVEIHPHEPEEQVPAATGTDNTERTALSPESIRNAQRMGAEVADLTVGMSSDSQNSWAKDIIMHEVNENTVIKFIQGYEDARPDVATFTSGDHFFEQMRTEYNNEDGQEILRKVGQDLLKYLQNKYGVESEVANEVASALLDSFLNKNSTKKLDNIVIKEINK